MASILLVIKYLTYYSGIFALCIDDSYFNFLGRHREYRGGALRLSALHVIQLC